MKSGFVLATAFTGLVLTAPPLSAQVSISGTDCTLSGGTKGNLYTISGDLLPSDTIAWTVTGGYLVANGNASLSGTIANKGTQVRIIWNSGGGAHQLQLSHKRLGMASLNVRVTDMDVSIHAPVLAVAPGAAVTLNGNSPAISACTPLYEFWWEAAPDSVGPFVQVNNARDAILGINATAQKTWYRRVFFVNGDVLYSNIVPVNVTAAVIPKP